jgi:hypothetical protein
MDKDFIRGPAVKGTTHPATHLSDTVHTTNPQGLTIMQFYRHGTPPHD